jgi:TM2 domain-containing membrane protein YozV
MKLDKKTNYFVSVTEFKEINKNPFIAGILSIFLGMFGVHRFYLKRKWTGFTFLLLSIFSSKFGGGSIVAIIMLISLAEGIVYIIRGVILLKEKYTDNKIVKSKYIEKLDKITNNENKNKVNEINIIEVSNIKSTKIPKKSEFSNIYKNNWVKKLELPYERNIMEVEQVKEETLNFYEKLCDFIDRQLRNSKGSLNKEVRRIGAEGGYYNNILYTIYCISEGHVTKAYSGGYNYYDPEYSYKLLEEHLGTNLKEKVFIKAQEFEKNISSPKEGTLIYFNLTKNGLPRKWWDKDGELRTNREFSNKELNILNATPVRNTIVWDIHSVNKQIIALYLEIWQIISNGLDSNLKWKKKNKNTLQNIIDGKYMYFADYENGKILSSLIKISENTIREIMPNTQILNISNEQDNIKKYLPKEIVDAINNKLIEFKENINDKHLKEILEDMIKKNPDDWKLKVEEILMCGTDKGINILIDYNKDEDFIKIAKDIIKKTDDENLLLLCLYGIEMEEKLSQRNAKLLEDIIHPSNISIYENILESKEAPSLKLFTKLVELKNPIRKKIELDMDKVEVSKKELNETVEIVKEYIGDEEDKEELQKENLKNEVLEAEHDEKVEFKYGEFLNLILDTGTMEIEEGKKMAMDNGTLLNAFISDVNRELYEYIQDQAVVIEDEYIKIDDFYVDMVKELVMSEE